MKNKENFFRNFLRNRATLAYNLFMFIGANQDGSLTYQTQLTQRFQKSITTINYHITKFKREGLINPKSLRLTSLGEKLFRYLWENAKVKRLRAHNIQIKFNLIKCPMDYVTKYSDNIFFEPFGNGRYSGLKGKQGGITFMIYSTRKIICVVKNILGDNDEEISSAIQVVCQGLIEKIESIFPGVKIGGFSHAKIQTSHIAVLDSMVSEVFDEKGFTYEGDFINLDKSNGRYEIEATDPSTNLTDVMYLLGLENKLKEILGKGNLKPA